VNALVLLDKDAGQTSHAAVLKAQRFLGARKAGHAGTLDPMATGLLLICLNEATKMTNLFADFDKEYLVTMQLGTATDTYDAEGHVTQQCPVDHLTEQDIRVAAESMRGTIKQIPPMYSAVKLHGKPLYKLARKGITVQRAPRIVTISELELEDITMPYVRMRVCCSKGTYIRSLCHDIGVYLGVGAHVTMLRRTRIGPFHVQQAVSLADLKNSLQGIISIDHALGHLPALVLQGEGLRRLRHGNPITVTDAELTEKNEAGLLRLLDPARRMFGIGRISGSMVTPVRLFADTALPMIKEELL
jgi:tRNA pseudouridine55 synthase